MMYSFRQEIQAVLFDLDDTIWDFRANADRALRHVWELLVQRRDLPMAQCQRFLQEYWKNNECLWQKYREGLVDPAVVKVKRFELTLADLGLSSEEQLAHELADIFLEQLYQGTILMPGAREVLEYLYGRYALGIVTNGFQAGLSRLALCGIKKYFHYAVSSEEFGTPKPHASIFLHAVRQLEVESQQAVYVGDNFYGDIVGSKKAGLHSIFFNHRGEELPENEVQPDYVIHELWELKGLL